MCSLSLCSSLLEYSMIVKLLTEHHLEFLSLKGGCTGSSESTVHMSKCLIFGNNVTQLKWFIRLFLCSYIPSPKSYSLHLRDNPVETWSQNLLHEAVKCANIVWLYNVKEISSWHQLNQRNRCLSYYCITDLYLKQKGQCLNVWKRYALHMSESSNFQKS